MVYLCCRFWLVIQGNKGHGTRGQGDKETRDTGQGDKGTRGQGDKGTRGQGKRDKLKVKSEEWSVIQ